MASYGELISRITPEERGTLRERISKIIGTQDEAKAQAKNLSDRIAKSEQWRKQYEKLAKIFLENGDKALALNFTQDGRMCRGVTASGKQWVLYGNNGMEERSRYCGTLYINGETIFTSGRLDKAFEYILNN